MIKRADLVREVSDALLHNPIVTLLGPRQCGKTTLARQLADESQASFFDLENPADQARLAEPMTALSPLRSLVVIDEAQLKPDLYPILRVLADRANMPARFLLLGSATPELVRGCSESLAGRTAIINMAGFELREVGADNLRRLWLRGGFPRAYLAENDAIAFQWRNDFIQLFLERDLRNLGVQVLPATLRRFWTMLTHYHGQLWNGSEIGRSLGESHHTVRRHLDLLTGAFMVRQLQPWFQNVGKRVVKSPKVYIRDSGILHALMGVESFAELEAHPRLGASWEGFVIEQIIRRVGQRNVYFWATQGGAELDLVIMARGKSWGVEVKYADAPSITRSMQSAFQDLKLEHLWVVYPGPTSFELRDRISATAVSDLDNILTELKAGGT